MNFFCCNFFFIIEILQSILIRCCWKNKNTRKHFQYKKKCPRNLRCKINLSCICFENCQKFRNKSTKLHLFCAQSLSGMKTYSISSKILLKVFQFLAISNVEIFIYFLFMFLIKHISFVVLIFIQQPARKKIKNFHFI